MSGLRNLTKPSQRNRQPEQVASPLTWIAIGAGGMLVVLCAIEGWVLWLLGQVR